MAIHKKLGVGSLLFTYHYPDYDSYAHRRGEAKYHIRFKALYVHNRRERSTGVPVPKTLIPTLEKLGIKYNEFSHTDVIAVGCRSYTYHSCRSNLPYPSADDVTEASRVLKEKLESDVASNEGVSLMEIDFIQDFKEKKMSNKDALFSLNKPLQDYVSNELIIN